METQKCNKCSILKPLTEYRFRNKLGYHHKICKECQRKKHAEWIANNLEHNREKARNHYHDNKEMHIKSHANWKNNNPTYFKDYMHKYNKENRKAINERSRPYNREHYRTNDNYRLRMLIGGRIRRVFNQKGVYKNNTTLDFLGCSFDDAKDHIKKQFVDGMTWNKFRNGEIHIDHIKPCASYDLTDPEQQKECFHYTNLQPLWAIDNMKKGCKYVESL